MHKIHELIEGLCGVVDNFVAIGWGDTFEEVSKDHDQNLGALLRWCREWWVSLNADKRWKKLPLLGI